jgi:hypothetical protein
LTSKCVANVPKFTGAHSQKNCGPDSAGAPFVTRSPTGRIPHDLSREPTTVSGATSTRVPSISSHPVQRPNCVSRV